MSTEGHNCWEDCDEGPHGCVCGNDCAPPRWMTEQDEREAQSRGYWMRVESARDAPWCEHPIVVTKGD